MARFCIGCGSPLEESARFCNKCGTPAYAPEEAQAPATSEPSVSDVVEEAQVQEVVEDQTPELDEPVLTESFTDEPSLAVDEPSPAEETQVIAPADPIQASQDDEVERAAEVTEALDSLEPQQVLPEPVQQPAPEPLPQPVQQPAPELVQQFTAETTQQLVAEPTQQFVAESVQPIAEPVQLDMQSGQPTVEQTQQMPVAAPAQLQPNAAGYCHVCGAPLELGGAFCQKCGAPAGASATNANQYAYSAAQTAYNTQDSEDDHLIPTWLLGVLAAIAVVVVALVVINPFNIGKSSDANESQTNAASTEAASTEAASTAAASTKAVSTAAASTQATTTAAADNYVNGIGNESTEYILPESNTRVYSTSELSVLTTAQLELARNEIYARYGREFKTDYISAHFKSKSWYHVQYSAEEFDAIQESVFNSYEKQNIANIKAVEATR